MFSLIIHCFLGLSQGSLLVVFGPNNPLKLRESFPDASLVTIESFLEPSNEERLKVANLILDVSLDLTTQALIASKSALFEVPYLSLLKPLSNFKSQLKYSVFPSVSFEAEALGEMISFLKWDAFTVFLSNRKENILILDLLRNKFNKSQIKSLIYSPEVAESELDGLVKRYLKITSDHNILILDQGPSLALLIKLLNTRKIGKFGKYFLFGPSSHCLDSLEGSVALCYQNEVNIETVESAYVKVLADITENFQYTDKNEISQRCPSHICLSEMLIINQRYNERKVVGSIKDSIFINESLIFPGNNTKINQSFKKTQIPIMIANGTREPNDLGNSENTSRFYFGALYAVELKNAELADQNFEYQLIPTDCGNTVLNITWTTKCLSRFSGINSIAYLTGYWVQSAIANLIAFKTFRRFLPQISPDSYSDILNNKTSYPEFIKLSGRFEDFLENSIFLFLFNGWKEVILLVDQDEVHKNYFENIQKIMQTMNIHVLNPEKFRYLPSNYTRDDFETYRHIFQYVKDSRCRIIMLLTTDTGVVYEAFYDVGLRKGDLIVIGYIRIYHILIENIEEKYLMKRKEILAGALIANHLQYQGKYGKSIEKALKERYQNVACMCLTFDAFKTVSNSVQYLVSRGEDYEDPQLFMKVMRNQKLIGCSGSIHFVSGENSRDKAWLGISQIVIDPKTNLVDMIEILALNKFAVIAAQKINEPVWPNGEKSVPSNFRPIQKCVFGDHSQTSKYGKLSLHIFSMIYLGLVIVSALFSYRKFEMPVPLFTEKVHVSYNDMIHQLFFISELFQILSLEPSDGLFTKVTKGLNLKLGLDFLRIFELKFDDFWNFYIILLIFVGFWSVLTGLSQLIKAEVFKKYEYLDFFKLFSESVLPVVGHLGFMPLSLMLLSIYKCEKGVSDDLFDSFFYRDCTEYCFKGKHRLMVITSSLVMLIFFTMSIYLRPFWEQSQNDQHIRTKVNYLSFFSVFQFLLVLIRVNLEETSKSAQGFLMFGVLSSFAVFTVRLRPFNYEKSNVFQVFILALCSWNMIVTSFYSVFGFERQLTVVLFLGIIFIMAFGFKIIGKYPSMFISDHNDAVPVLLKFQFSKDIGQTIKEASFYRNIELKLAPNK